VGSRKVLGAIHDWMEERSKGKYADSPYFFIIFRSGHPTHGAVEKMVKRIRERSGVFFTTHMLRHTHGHDIQEETKDIRKTQEALRQRDNRSTVIYTQLSKEEMQAIYRETDSKY
jgi:integrase/recombinase XerD